MGKFTLSLNGPLLKIPDSIKSAPFDYVGRYQLIAEIINQYFSDPRQAPKSILDVGGLGSLLGQILPIPVYILDTKIDKNSKNKINGSEASSTILKDEAHEIIVSSDTIEHVARKDRQEFVDNLVRLSSDLIIICSPTSDGGTAAEESTIQKIYRGATGKSHLWLREHSEHGLPSKKELQEYFDKHKLSTIIINHNSLDIWRHLMFINLLADITEEGKIHRAAEEINRFYNKNILFKDFTENNYRTFIVASKKRELEFKNSNKALPESRDYLKLLQLTNNLYSSVIGFYIYDLPSVGVIGETFKAIQRRTAKQEIRYNQLLARYNHLLHSKTWRYTESGRKMFRLVRKIIK